MLCGEYEKAKIASEKAVRANDLYLATAGEPTYYLLGCCHDLHLLMFACMFLGQFAPALEAADKVRRLATRRVLSLEDRPKLTQTVEGYHAMRSHVLVRFGRWQDIVDEPMADDPELYVLTTALQHYAKGVAHAALGHVAEAGLERERFHRHVARIPAGRRFLSNPTRASLAVGAALLDGELAYHRAEYDEAYRHLRQAVVEPGRWVRSRSILAGFLAAYASVVEIQVGPVSAILGLSLIALVLARRRPAGCLAAFALGASIPTLLLLGYNQVAFDSPWKMGYFFLVAERFKEVHSTDNPLGLIRPDLAKVRELLWGERRGLLCFAPILALAPLGLILMSFGKRRTLAGLIVAISTAIFLVNLSYPEWTGGWTTGPRLLVPMLPFACLAVAPVLATNRRIFLIPALVLALVGGVEMLLFGGVGGRIPDGIVRPLVDGVWPIWRGDRLPGWVFGQRFARNLVTLAFPQLDRQLPPSLGFLIFLPLVGFQALAIVAMFRCLPKNARSDPCLIRVPSLVKPNERLDPGS